MYANTNKVLSRNVTKKSFKIKFSNYLFFVDDSVDVTSEPYDQDVSISGSSSAASSHNPNKGQLEVQLGGSVTL